MKKYLIIIFVIGLNSFSVNSQSVEFTNTQKIKMRKNSYLYLLGSSNNNCYSVVKTMTRFMNGHKSITINTHNIDNMSIINTPKVIENPNIFAYYLDDNYFFINNKVVVFAFSPKKLLSGSINPNSNEEPSFAKIIESTYATKFSLTASIDKSKILITYPALAVKGENTKFNIKVIDDKVSSLYEKTIELPYLSGSLSNLKFKLDELDNIIITAVRKIDKDKSELLLFTYSLKNSKLIENKVNLEGKSLYYVSANISEDFKQIVVTSQFAKASSGEGRPTKGCFISIFDRADLKLSKAFEYVFNESDLFKEEKDVKGIPNLFDNLILRETILKDNKITIISESMNSSSTTTRTPAYGPSLPTNTSTSSTYTYGPIFVFDFDLQANLLNSKLISEFSFYTRNSYYGSFGLVNYGSSFGFIFNDGGGNTKKMKTYLTIAKDKENPKRELVLDSKKSKYTIACSENIKVNDGTYVFINSNKGLTKMIIK